MSTWAKRLLDRVRQEPRAGKGHSVRPPRPPYRVITIGLYHSQLAHVDQVAAGLRRHVNQAPSRSLAVQVIIEAHRAGQETA